MLHSVTDWAEWLRSDIVEAPVVRSTAESRVILWYVCKHACAAQRMVITCSVCVPVTLQKCTQSALTLQHDGRQG